MKSWREKLVEYGTYFVVFLTPLLYFGASRFISYATSKTFFFYGSVEIILGFWLYQIFIDSSYRLSKKSLLAFLPFLLYIFWLLLASVLGENPSMSFWSSLGRGTGMITMLHALAFSLIISSLMKKYGLLKYGYRLLAWFVGGASIVAISVWLGNEGFNIPFTFLEKSQGGGLIGNSSLTASMFVFAIFFEIFLLSAKDVQTKYKTWISIGLGLILFSPLFLSIYSLLSKGFFGSSVSARGAALGIIVGLIFSLCIYLTLSKDKWKKVVGILALIFGLTISIIGWQNLMTPGTVIHEGFSKGATESRFIFWDIAKKAMNDRPILGFGPENYSIAYQKYFDPRIFTLGESVEVWNDRAHNVFFDTGVAGGYPAVILYVIFLGSLLWAIFIKYKLGTISRFQAATLSGLIVAYFSQHLFVFDSLLSIMGLAVLVGVLFGEGKEESSGKTIVKKKPENLIAVILFLIFIPAWIIFAWMPSRKSVAIARVITMPLNTRPDHYIDLLKGSSIGDGFEIGGIAEDSYNLYSKNENKIKEDPQLLKYSLIDLEKFISYIEIVSKQQPTDYRLKLNLARLYNVYMFLSDKTDDQELIGKALAVEDEAQALSETNPQIYWTRAQTLVYKKDTLGAQKTLEKAIEIAPYIDFSKELLDKINKKSL